MASSLLQSLLRLTTQEYSTHPFFSKRYSQVRLHQRVQSQRGKLSFLVWRITLLQHSTASTVPPHFVP